jgi:hypothetical protein
MTMHTLFGPWTSDDLAVLEVGDDEWRVSDLQTRRAHGPAFVGMVRRRGALFYANNLPLECPAQVFGDLESAVAYLEDVYLASDGGLDEASPWSSE